MSLSEPPEAAQSNQLLAALPSEVFLLLSPYLERIVLNFNEVICEARESMTYVYFPVNSVISLLATTDNETTTEVAVVGYEGMVGLSAFLGVNTELFKGIVQIAGEAIRIRTDIFKVAVELPPLHNLLLRHTSTILQQVSQSAFCNYHHSVEKRCCRLLLMLHDCARSDNLPLTQDYLSKILSVRRASVNEVTSKLQKEGFIAYSYGQIRIQNREGLEQTACECYKIIKNHRDRLLD
ncbi:MAG: Crp/Fnr family transcriptional regulator [Scytonema sp. PMC 1069.18]|nr:Crp/Fnr family transcriptional regulator [Scytonema sp. PMC 1069.18]MEC4883056.1 Crp/Fnr family transcriptional regulator [Scytonema sp. PMC 1070.18]